MAKDPAFLFYASDFLTGTMFMSDEQVGIYIRLLCSQHQHGGLIDKMSFDSRVGSHGLVRAKFVETEIGFFNERLAKEMDRRNKKSNNLSQAAKEVWNKRKSDTIVLQSHKKSKRKVKVNDTIAIQPVNVTEIVNYFLDNGYSKEAAEKFFKYYSEADWIDSNGKKVKSWKQKAQSVWFKDENKINGPKPGKFVM